MFHNGCRVDGVYPREPFNRWDERHLARLAAAQDAIVRLDQLAALGLSPDGRRTRLAQHRLIELYRGIYAVGHDDLTERGRSRAAVWAGGEGALLSDRAAARLLGLWERPVRELTIAVPAGRNPQPWDVAVRRTKLLHATHVRGIACTSVSQTLVDLAAREKPPALEAALERAERRGWIRPALLDAICRGRPGAANVRALLATHQPKSGRTKSLLERRLLAGLRHAGLPEPIVNGHLELEGEIIEPDLVWPRQRVLVELDGGETHATPTAMRRDRRRDRLALRHGWTPMRATWHDEIAAVVADIAAVLRE